MDRTESNRRRVALDAPMSAWPALLLISVTVVVSVGILIHQWLKYGEFMWSLAILVAFGTYWLQRNDDWKIWDSVPFLEITNNKLIFRHSKLNGECANDSEVAYQHGSEVECHVETGDAYFSGDRGAKLRQSLWVVSPDGKKQLLTMDFPIRADLNACASNLGREGIPLRVIQVYDGQDGEHTETDITKNLAQQKRDSTAKLLLLGSSSLWLGAVAGAVITDPIVIAGIGAIAFLVVAVFVARSFDSKRIAMLQVTTLLPSYGGSFFLAVVVARYLVKTWPHN